MELKFQNIYGNPVELKAQPIKREKIIRQQDQHLGFVVVGFSPDHLRDAERAHNAEREIDPEKKEWDESIYMRTGKPRRARPKPYEIPDAAEQVAGMLRAAGWKGVRVEELIRKA